MGYRSDRLRLQREALEAVVDKVEGWTMAQVIARTGSSQMVVRTRLLEAGYTIDTSERPGVWRRRRGGQ